MNIFPGITRSKPVSEQVQELLRSRILQGVYSPHERMPSEERLAQELDVSRATVRTALAALAAEGLVQRRHGDGTYPVPNTIELTVRAREAWNIIRQIQRSGRAPGTQVLEQGLRPANEQERSEFELPEGAQVFDIRRLFTADGLPVCVAHHVLRAESFAPDALQAASELPLLEFLATSQQALKPGEVGFKAVGARGDTAERLQVEPGSPLLLIEARVLDQQGRPLLQAREYYRGEEGFWLPVAPFQI
jgi:GntR family transcriptional regulator